MWDYSDKVMEYYRNPKNSGSIDDATVIGEAGSLSCGDMLKLYLKVDEKGIITDAKFQTFGCGSAVASSSVLTEMIIGKHIDEARKITNEEIVKELGGLPPEKMHCSVMGHEALESAISRYYNEDNNSVDDETVCSCFNITKSFLINEIKHNNLKTLEEVTNYTKAGGACGRCKDKIRQILSETMAQDVKEEKPLTKTQQIIKINNVIEKFISNELRKDGGDIELVDVDGNKVYVNLKGRCSACNRSNLTLKHFVETSLQKHISKDIEVIQV